ncbi:hypothetical protein BHYA_0526g00030 [Botrytis hyacinthi]|uniref:Pectate lyase domain-containing protein n=1 Tax=Botrytis hyacinthi TaxID=278943 RepID=A0A4Z1GBH9_9HELO|nr:hypothetical protein BHYA_0526g00030 [Botrytis hyacinthi]
MVSINALAILLFSVIAVDAAGVIGKAEGFAAGATGGGTAAAASPKDLNELVNWLSDGVARTIVLDKTWDFTGSMGSKTEKGCTPLSNTCTNGAGQDSVDINGWCEQAANANQALAKPTITYDVAGIPPNAIKLGSNKSIVGVGSAGKIKGRGFYIAGAKNIIIQNVDIFGVEMLSPLMAQIFYGSIMITMGPGASNRVSITNSEFDGTTLWSAKCNNHHYWTLYFTGSQDTVTFKGNYIHITSGRGPKVGGLHSSVEPIVFFQAANNYWSDIQGVGGIAFQIGEGAKEGNIFENAATPVLFDIPSNPLWSSSNGVAGCASILGRNCQANNLAASGSFAGTNTDVLTVAKSLAGSLAAVADVSTTKANVLKNAGIGKIQMMS